MLRKTMSDEIVDINDNPIGLELIDILIQCNFCKSRTEGRKLIKGGGIKINNIKVQHPFARLFKYEEFFFLIEGREYEIIGFLKTEEENAEVAS